MSRSLNPSEESAAAKFPQIRHMKVQRVTGGHPVDDLSSTWQVCSPETVGNFTGAGYFMARELHKELGVPIGLINSSWGGTRIEPWTPIAGFAQVPALKDIYDKVVMTQPDQPAYQKTLNDHMAATRKWLAEAEAAVSAGTAAPESPASPVGLSPLRKNSDPTALYNPMIHPLVGYGMRGAISNGGGQPQDRVQCPGTQDRRRSAGERGILAEQLWAGQCWKCSGSRRRQV